MGKVLMLLHSKRNSDRNTLAEKDFDGIHRNEVICISRCVNLLSVRTVYANCIYFVIVATEFFTNWNAIEGWGRGDFRTVSHKEITRIVKQYGLVCVTRVHCIVF